MPEPSPQRLAIKLKPAAEKSVKQGHPWVYDKGISKINKEGKAGDLAIIFDSKKNKFLALGLYDPDSPIRIKMIAFGQSTNLNQDWFLEKVATAYQIRQPLFKQNTNAYRLLYGENDGLPGCIADVYNKVLVLKIYSAIWFPYLDWLVAALQESSGCETMLLRLNRNLQQNDAYAKYKDGMVILGTLKEEEVYFTENGVRFCANVIKGHKTGFFLDHRFNRKKVGDLSKGKTVLDVFSYTGGFSTHALANGAKQVTSVDISAPALAFAKKNVALNAHKGSHETIAQDAFKALQEMLKSRRKFDIVVIDPPSFAKKQSEIEKAIHQYERLAKIGARLVAPKGILILASCSARVSREAFFAANEKGFALSNKRFQCIETVYHDIDHPIGFPEGAYLKAAYYKEV